MDTAYFTIPGELPPAVRKVLKIPNEKKDTVVMTLRKNNKELKSIMSSCNSFSSSPSSRFSSSFNNSPNQKVNESEISGMFEEAQRSGRRWLVLPCRGVGMDLLVKFSTKVSRPIIIDLGDDSDSSSSSSSSNSSSSSSDDSSISSSTSSRSKTKSASHKTRMFFVEIQNNSPACYSMVKEGDEIIEWMGNSIFSPLQLYFGLVNFSSSLSLKVKRFESSFEKEQRLRIECLTDKLMLNVSMPEEGHFSSEIPQAPSPMNGAENAAAGAKISNSNQATASNFAGGAKISNTNLATASNSVAGANISNTNLATASNSVAGAKISNLNQATASNSVAGAKISNTNQATASNSAAGTNISNTNLATASNSAAGAKTSNTNQATASNSASNIALEQNRHLQPVKRSTNNSLLSKGKEKRNKSLSCCSPSATTTSKRKKQANDTKSANSKLVAASRIPSMAARHGTKSGISSTTAISGDSVFSAPFDDRDLPRSWKKKESATGNDPYYEHTQSSMRVYNSREMNRVLQLLYGVLDSKEGMSVKDALFQARADYSDYLKRKSARRRKCTSLKEKDLPTSWTRQLHENRKSYVYVHLESGIKVHEPRIMPRVLEMLRRHNPERLSVMDAVRQAREEDKYR